MLCFPFASKGEGHFVSEQAVVCEAGVWVTIPNENNKICSIHVIFPSIFNTFMIE
jgi:hypothetical protein